MCLCMPTYMMPSEALGVLCMKNLQLFIWLQHESLEGLLTISALATEASL
jgi:hypothetical protein